MSDSQENIITVRIHQSQLDSLWNALLTSFLEDNAKQMVDLLYHTIQTPFQKKGEQLAIVILDKRRRGIIAAFLIKIGIGGSIQSIETIPLDLTLNGYVLSDLFKVQELYPLKLIKELLETNFGNLWTLCALDLIQISKLFDLLNFEPTKELIGKVTSSFIDRMKKEKIKLFPVPEVIKALEKIL